MKDELKLAFLFGLIMRDYDQLYFTQAHHIDEVIDFHARGIQPRMTTQQVDLIKQIAKLHYETK